MPFTPLRWTARQWIAASVLVIAVGGCGSEQPASRQPSVDASRPADPMGVASVAMGPAPNVEIEIANVRAWNDRGRWALEADVTLTNRESKPVELITQYIRLRDQSQPLSSNVLSEDVANPLEPGAAGQVCMLGARHPHREAGQPTLLHVDYGTIFGMTQAASAPVEVVRTDGLVAKFSDPQPPARGETEYIQPHGTQPLWEVRLTITIENPTPDLVRLRDGQLSAVGAMTSGHSIAESWFEPGASRRGSVTLEFEDAPDPPSEVTLSFGSSPPQTISLP